MNDDLDNKYANEIERLCRVAGGVSFAQLMAHANLPQPRIYDLLGRLMASDRIARRGGLFVATRSKGKRAPR